MRSKSSKTHRRPQLLVEVLEDRRTPATLTVNSTGDDTTAMDGLVTLREAIIAANTDGPTDGGGTGSGKDEIVFAPSLSGSTITLGGTQLPQISADLTITGLGSGALTVDADGMSGLLRINNGISASVTGLTLTGGNSAGGGAILNLGNLTVQGVAVSSNISTTTGGGIFTAGGSLKVVNSTISGNSSTGPGGGIYGINADVTVTNSTLSENVSKSRGGGIEVNTGSTLALTNSTVVLNAADSDNAGGEIGGGISPFNTGTATLTNSIIAGNTRTGGTTADDIAEDPFGPGVNEGASNGNVIGDPNSSGGIADSGTNVVGDGAGGILAVETIIDPTLRENGGPTLTHNLAGLASPAIGKGIADTPETTDQRGAPFGRVFNGRDAGAVEFQAVALPLVVDNSGDGSDGNYSAGQFTLREAMGIANGSNGADTITFSDSLNGSTITLGGTQLPSITGDLTISGPGATPLTVDANGKSRVFETGAGTTVGISGLTITGGNMVAAGGGISNGGKLTLTSSTVSGNTATVNGGAIVNFGGGELTVSNSTLSGNDAPFGGAIDSYAPLAVINSTISGNTASGSGGGLENHDTMTVVNSTVTGNRSDSDGAGDDLGGGISTFAGASTTLTNSVVTGNFRGTGVGTPDDLNGDPVQPGSTFNLIGDAATAGGLMNGMEGNLVGVDAKLGPLADNGGPTMTHALLAGSPALNAGSDALAVDGGGASLMTDGRGTPFARSSGSNVDLGAFEAQSLTLTVDNIGDGVDGDVSAGQLTLREAVTLANANPGADTITFNPSLNGKSITMTGNQFPAITGDLTITGPGADTLEISAKVMSRHFEINEGVTASISGLRLTAGDAPAGGSILNRGTLTVTGAVIAENNSTGDGGGIFNAATGTLFLTNSTASGNFASNFGGGVRNLGTATITNSTISGNIANSFGGGIDSQSILTVVNSTIVLNRADADGNSPFDGGGISTDGLMPGLAKTTLHNTIVAGNLSGMGVGIADDLNGPDNVQSGSSFNLIGEPATAGGLVHGMNGNILGDGSGGILPLNKILNPIVAFNGGSTLSHVLVFGSPAIDAGSDARAVGPDGMPLMNDQRGTGFPRIAGASVDIGAVETVLVLPTVTVEQAAGQADPTNQAPVLFTATFSVPVFGFDSSDVVIGGTAGATTATVTDTGDGMTFTIAVSGMSQAGTVTASINAGVAGDAVGNPNEASTSVDNTVTFNTQPVNTPPVANDDGAVAQTDGGPLPLMVLANDTDADGDALTVTAVTQPANGSVTISADGSFVTYTPDAGFEGTDTFTYTISDGNGGIDTANVSVEVSPTAPPPPPPPPGGSNVNQNGTAQHAAGAGPGGPSTVSVFDGNGNVLYTVDAFPGFTGGVRTAVADVNGDGTPDLIVGTGPGGPTSVQIFDGKTKQLLQTIAPFEPAFTGGVYVAAGDVNGDGMADIAISPDEGGGPRVRLFSGADFSQLNDFFGIDDPNFRGGARVAFGDLNGDGKADLLVVAGFGGGPRIAGFDGVSVSSGSTSPVKLFNDFFVFEQTLRNGVFVASGDVNGDGNADIIVGGGPGGGPRVFGLSGQQLVASMGSNQVQVANFFAGNPASRGGIRVVVKNLDGDANGDIVVGAGTNDGSAVTRYLGRNIPSDGTPPVDGTVTAFAGFGNGVFVG